MAEKPAPDTTESSRSPAAKRILRAAERLFAQRGFDGASMREIATAADVGLSLVVYHFTSKAKLYESVFAAHQHVTDERLRRLRVALAHPGPEALDALVGALLDPMLELLDDPAHQWYVRLVFRQLSEGSRYTIATAGDGANLRAGMNSLFTPLAREFIDGLQSVLPGCEDDFYAWAYLFSLGALTQTVHGARAATFAGLDAEPGDPAPHLRRFVVAGLRGNATQSTGRHRPSDSATDPQPERRDRP